MITEWIEALGAWSWWIIGLAFLALELLLPGVIFLWFGIAAILIGVSALFVDWPWQFQILGFGVLSLVTALIGRRLLNYRDTPSDDPNLNERAARIVGRDFNLSEPIVNGTGRLKVGDSWWNISGPDLEVGERVKVVGSEGTVLTVEGAPEPEDAS